MNQVIATVTTGVVLAALLLLALTEFIGARVPGFWTISDAAQRSFAHGDYRLFLLVLALFQIGGLWWACHVIFKV